MTLIEKIATYLRSIENAKSLEAAQREARLARRLIEKKPIKTEEN